MVRKAGVVMGMVPRDSPVDRKLQWRVRRRSLSKALTKYLHMKMLESIVDSKQPSTIVLATGDAAEAEYSGGFLKNVERALSKGWKVELVAWGHSMSYAYRSQHFLEKWKDQFMIIDLDEFSEELLGMYIAPSYHSYVRYTEVRSGS